MITEIAKGEDSLDRLPWDPGAGPYAARAAGEEVITSDAG